MLVALGIDADLFQDGAGGRDVGAEQMDGGSVAVRRAACGFAIDGEGVPTVVLDAAENPASQGLLQSGNVQTAEELAQATFVGRQSAGEAQGVGESPAVVASELGNGFQTLHSCQGSDDGQGEDGHQWVTPALGGARVRNMGQLFYYR